MLGPQRPLGEQWEQVGDGAGAGKRGNPPGAELPRREPVEAPVLRRGGGARSWLCLSRQKSGQKALCCRSRACPQGIAPGRARRIAGAAPREGSGEPSPARFAHGGASWGAGSGAVRAPPSQGCSRRFPSLGSSRRRGARQKSLISRADAAAGEGAPGAAPRCSFASVTLVRSFHFFFLFFLLSPPV